MGNTCCKQSEQARNLSEEKEIKIQNKMSMGNVLITGVSSGVGLELCKQILEADPKNVVYGTVRSRAGSASKKDLISELEAANKGRLIVVEGVDIGKDACMEVLKTAMKGVMLDVLIHNAGGLYGHAGGAREGYHATTHGDPNPMALFTGSAYEADAQLLIDEMRAAFEVNTLGPLRVQKALEENMKTSTEEGVTASKVVVNATWHASLADNNPSSSMGGMYPYRVSKTAGNMVARNMAIDLGKKGIAVIAMNPGTLFSDFGPRELFQMFGAKEAPPGVANMLKLTADLSVKNMHGEFWTAMPNGDATEPEAARW